MDSELYHDKYRIASARWVGHDYGQNGMYFVTICTQNRERYFGEIEPGKITGEESVLKSTALAERALMCWLEVSEHFPFAIADAFVVMPDHIHGILFFEKETPEAERPNSFGPQRQNLASVIRGFKVEKLGPLAIILLSVGRPATMTGLFAITKSWIKPVNTFLTTQLNGRPTKASRTACFDERRRDATFCVLLLNGSRQEGWV